MGLEVLEDEISIDTQKFLDVIGDYAAYPQFVDGVKAIDILNPGEEPLNVRYHLNLMGKEVSYVLKHYHERDRGHVRWEMVDGDFFKRNSGSWDLSDAGGGRTKIKYSLDVEFKVPIPGFIRKRLVKGNMPGVVKSFAEQARKR